MANEGKRKITCREAIVHFNGQRLMGKAKQGMENKKRREKESNTVILCRRFHKQAGHVEQKQKKSPSI